MILGPSAVCAVCVYSEDMRAGTAVETPHGTPRSVRCHARGLAGWGPGTWTAACWSSSLGGCDCGCKRIIKTVWDLKAKCELNQVPVRKRRPCSTTLPREGGGACGTSLTSFSTHIFISLECTFFHYHSIYIYKRIIWLTRQERPLERRRWPRLKTRRESSGRIRPWCFSPELPATEIYDWLHSILKYFCK